MSALARPEKFHFSEGAQDIESKTFQEVGGRHLEHFPVLAKIFHRILTPLYGSQDKALEQIRSGFDRKCFLLYEEEVPVGVLVFKTVLSNEFERYGIRDSIEIKSLFLDQSVNNSGRGLGSALIDKVKEEASKLKLGHKGLHVTVSETKKESLLFFMKKGFFVAHEWQGRYQKGTTEYLLSCPANIEAIEKGKIIYLPSLASGQSERESPAELVHIIHNAHLDDVHTLTKLSDGTFVSGSKDNCLYKWNSRGEKVRNVDEVEPIYRDERNWITAAAVLNDEYWLTGDRSGKVVVWKTNGDYVREIKLRLPRKGAHVSHEFNTKRINCLSGGSTGSSPVFFVGLPTLFDEYNFIEGRTVSSVQTHKNDWVYCIYPLDASRLLTVTGCTIDLWARTDRGSWAKMAEILKEGQRFRCPGESRSQRPFISSLVPLRAHEGYFGVSFFDGSVQVLDIVEKKVINQWREHHKRVWHIQSLSERLFASSGEDRTIKLWDIRSEKSVHTIANHVGQVTAMLALNENTLIAGTCPEGALEKNKGAEIRFYDIR